MELFEDGEDPIFGFTMVMNGYTWVKSNNFTYDASSLFVAKPLYPITPSDPTRKLGTTRETFGKYNFESFNERHIGIYELKYTGSDFIYNTVYESSKYLSEQLGNDFYIYWPYFELIMSRQINGRYWDLFDFKPIKAGDASQYYRFDELVAYQIEIEGILDFHPVFYGEHMYIMRDLNDQIILSKYTNRGWGLITGEDLFIVTGTDSTIYGQAIDVLYTCDYAKIDSFIAIADGLFYRFSYTNTDSGISSYKSVYMDLSGVSPSYDESYAFSDSAFNDEEWFFRQRRLHPDDLSSTIPDVYAYTSDSTKKQILHKISLDTVNQLILIDEEITLPYETHWQVDDHDGTCEPDCPGRFDLTYPWDIGEKWLINLSPQVCNGRSRYEWDYFEQMSIAYYNIEFGNTGCYTLDDINCETNIDGYCDCDDPYYLWFDAHPGGAPYSLQCDDTEDLQTITFDVFE